MIYSKIKLKTTFEYQRYIINTAHWHLINKVIKYDKMFHYCYNLNCSADKFQISQFVLLILNVWSFTSMYEYNNLYQKFTTTSIYKSANAPWLFCWLLTMKLFIPALEFNTKTKFLVWIKKAWLLCLLEKLCWPNHEWWYFSCLFETKVPPR